MLREPYYPLRCRNCGQTTSYELILDKGPIDILKAMSVAINRLGWNEIHPRKDMEVGKDVALTYELMIRDGLLSSNQVGNLSRLRYHGLIAKVDNKAGYYAITKKGFEFLRGARIPLIAIISKADRRLMGYWHELEYTCEINDFKHATEYWSGLKYIIKDKRVYYLANKPTGQVKLI